jgi:hypothetical protein
MQSMRVIRWVLVGLSMALAVVLVRRGNVVVGMLIGALAVTRAFMFVHVQRRRERLRREIARRRGFPA